LSGILDPPALVTCSLRWIPGEGVPHQEGSGREPPGSHTTAQRPRTHADTSRASHKVRFCVTTLGPKGYASLTLKAAHHSPRIGLGSLRVRCRSPSPDDVQMRAYLSECPEIPQTQNVQPTPLWGRHNVWRGLSYSQSSCLCLIRTILMTAPYSQAWSACVRTGVQKTHISSPSSQFAAHFRAMSDRSRSPGQMLEERCANALRGCIAPARQFSHFGTLAHGKLMLCEPNGTFVHGGRQNAECDLLH